MKVIHKLRMDLARCGCRPILGAVQGEANTRVLEVDLYDNGIAWTIPSTAVVDVAYQKPDGTKGIYSKLPDGTKATTFSGNVLSATIAPQMVTCAGTIRAAFVFSNGGDETLATFPFTITVEANPAAGAERSEDYFNPKDISDLRAEVAAHAGRKDNPHGVTPAQIGAATPADVDTLVHVHPCTVTCAPGSLTVFTKNIGVNRGGLLMISGFDGNTAGKPFSLVAVLGWHATVLGYQQVGIGTNSYEFSGNAGSEGFTFKIYSSNITGQENFCVTVKVV